MSAVPTAAVAYTPRQVARVDTRLELAHRYLESLGLTWRLPAQSSVDRFTAALVGGAR